MALKEFTKEIFTRYGFTEDHILVYLAYLKVSRATNSEVYLSLSEGHEELTYERVLEITNYLLEKGFLKKLEGIVERYVPLEPYFELFTNESETFRNQIAKIKDKILADQSNRFEKLEAIQNKSIEKVENAVNAQLEEFFTESDNNNQNKKERIDAATNRFKETTKALEENLHGIADNLNSNLNKMCDTNVKDNKKEINQTKSNLSGLIAELLSDFSQRVKDLEKELKLNLEDHVERHKNISSELKPKMEQILEKYLERMDKIITDLKARISTLLKEHANHLKNTTETLQIDMKSSVENRHALLTEQTNKFKNKTSKLIDNLLTSTNRFSDFAQDVAKKGLFWTGKKPKYKARFEEIKENILSVSEPLRADFNTETNEYIKDTRDTTDKLKEEITEIISKENNNLTTETTDLNQKAQESIDIELEILAKDLAIEIDNTLQNGVKDCSDTSLKLEDTLESTLTEHDKQYDDAINTHKKDTLQHYSDFDAEIEKKSENWKGEVENALSSGKKDVSEKIDSEIDLWNNESADMNKFLSDMLDNHKSKYQNNAKTLQDSLSNTVRENAQDTKDGIADFTLSFMNSIDDSTELAETNETHLKEIFKASSAIPDSSSITTWHTIGREALVNSIKDAIYRTKSSIIIVTPVVIPEVLPVITEIAFQKKAARFMITSHFSDEYFNVIKKMQQLGNIQFRQLAQQGEYYAVTRDAEEVIICPFTDNEAEMVSIISNQQLISKLYSQFIGPIFQANSRPIK